MSALSSNPNSSLAKRTTNPVPKSIRQLETAKKYRWNQENYSITGRRLDIWRFVLLLLSQFWLNGKKWSYRGGYTDQKLANRRVKQAVWIRENLLNLGPTFIKVGQLFSTRADLFPSEYVDELSKLQDEVPAFTYEQATAIIEKEFGKPLAKLYRSFDPVPIAAASLGQVHKAKLHTGEEVVVKVQRPGLKQLFTIDLAILKRIAQYFQNHPRWGKGRDWSGIYEECCRILWLETDYLNEGQNADTFRRNFRGEDWVRVPRVYWRYTSARILTLEYLPGIKISHYEGLEAAGLDRKLLAKLGAKAYLSQLLNDGFFHADPHPGNLAVSTDGALIFYDFGMMGRIETNVREKLMDTLFGVTQKDADRVVSSLIALGALAPTDDMGPVRRSIQFILDNFMDKPFEEQSVTQISEDLYEIAYDQPFRFPATFTFVMRAFSTLEGVGKGLDPDFNFMEVAQPFALQIVTDMNGTNGNSILDELGRQAVQVSNTALGLPRRIEDTLEKLERGDIRVRVRSTESERLLRRLSLMQMTTNYTLVISALAICATLLLVNGYVKVAVGVMIVTLAPAWALFRLLRRVGRLDKMF
ncbi:ABC1-like protein [Aphanothece sacrum FPU1]|uniref:ABC1-like protein n=1 Tax=Aphanothece sacrum FPU1 TaxID=1920663 RepID=A0A401INS7_APHSA|nr:ABC1-like protein [Aphanothece sacrum FPU1]GBF86927.1 ABC transporter family protein [Aphanothece sacrum FPU3]